MPAPPLALSFETGVNAKDVATADTGSPDSWSAVSVNPPRYRQDFKHSGTLGMGYEALTSGPQFCRMNALGSITTDVWVRFYMWLPSLPPDNNFYPCTVRTAADGASALIRILASGIIQMRDASNSQIGSDGLVAVATGQWVRLEVRFRSSATVGQVEWWLYNNADSSVASDTAAATGAVLGANTDSFTLGSNTAAVVPSISVYFDDVAISSTGKIGPIDVASAYQ